MTNRNYNNGRYLEYQAIFELTKDGYYAQRSAGSHGIDIFAFLRKTNTEPDKPNIRAIMVTKDNRPSKIKDDMRKLLDCQFPHIVSKEVWLKIKGQKEFKVYKLKDVV